MDDLKINSKKSRKKFSVIKKCENDYDEFCEIFGEKNLRSTRVIKTSVFDKNDESIKMYMYRLNVMFKLILFL